MILSTCCYVKNNGRVLFVPAKEARQNSDRTGSRELVRAATEASFPPNIHFLSSIQNALMLNRAAPSDCGDSEEPSAAAVRQPAALVVLKASRCEATKSCTVIGGLPVSSAMILSWPEKMPF